MRLLILTQKVDRNDDLLGFFHRWLEEFAKHCEKASVICLEEGEHGLPPNVHVYSLGKESGTSKFDQTARFFRYIMRLRNEYEAVFVHMNPEYIVLAGWCWRLFGKRIALWYTHRAVNLKLRIAHFFVHTVFSASGFSFGIRSSKLRIVGHGLDTDQFVCGEQKKEEEEIKIICVGSLRPIKHQEVLIQAAAILKKKWDQRFSVLLIGGVSSGNEEFADELKELVHTLDVLDVVRLVGSVPNTEMPRYYCSADLSVNLCPDGGIDKVVIESMAAGNLALVSNCAFEPYFAPYADVLMFKQGNAEHLANQIMALYGREDRERISTTLKETAVREFSIERLIPELLNF
jgi:glycosyltransferase involved in cell wall biosynthesis